MSNTIITSDKSTHIPTKPSHTTSSTPHSSTSINSGIIKTNTSSTNHSTTSPKNNSDIIKTNTTSNKNNLSIPQSTPQTHSKISMNPIYIGDIKLSSNVILAPMSGVSDKPYRDIVENFAIKQTKRRVGMVVSEMVASDAIKRENEIALKKADITGSSLPCIQLAGYDPKIMEETAKMCEGYGARIIDINFGCPAKKIVNNYSGSALMRDVPRATAIIEAVVKAVKIPVTVKMRTGWDDNSRNAPELAKIAEDLGAKMITVHGRTRCQFYTGNADWKFVRNVKNNINLPVIVNGDIIDLATAKEALELSGADGVMIGRGAYGKPWLPAHIASYIHDDIIENPNDIKLLPIIKKHFIHMIEYYGENRGIKMARKHLGWYSKSIPNAIDFRLKINRLTCHKKTLKIITEFFQNR